MPPIKSKKPGLPVNIKKPTIQSTNAMGASGSTLQNVTVKPKTNRAKTFGQDIKSGFSGAKSAAGGGLLGTIAAVAQTPNIVGISAMGQQGYKNRKNSFSTPGGKKPLFNRDYPLSESPNPEFNNQK